MEIYVLSRSWDTPDNEGNEIMGAYYSAENAIADMKADADTVKAYYDADFWESDYTWEDEYEIHLGRGPDGCGLATIYRWEVTKVEVK